MIITSENGWEIQIDDEDLPLISKYKWSVYSLGHIYLRYAMAFDDNKNRIYMHRLIMNAPKRTYVDHKDRNGLNNHKDNLRITTQSINLANAGMFSNNTSGYRGVIWFRDGYRAQIKYKQQILQSPRHIDPVDAALLRDELARKLFGEEVYQNFPDIEPTQKVKDEAMRLLSKRDWL